MDIYSFYLLPFFFVYSVIASFISFYLPGRFFIKQTQSLSLITTMLLRVVLGIVLWGVQGYLLGYIHLRALTYLYVLFFLIVTVYKSPRSIHLSVSGIRKKLSKHLLACSLIIIGSTIQVLQMIGSGLMYKDGVRFFGVNGVDGIMHIAYIQSIKNYFPPVEPGSYDNPLVNYHYWSDLIIADIARVWHIPVTHLFFQFFPVLIALLTGIAAYKVVQVWGFSNAASIWSLFFLYFGGDATYLILLLVHKTLNFATPAIDNGATQFLNMPHAFAKLVFLTGLIPFELWLRKKSYYWGIITVIFFATLVGLKIYFGIFAILGFGLILLVYFLQNIVTFIKSHSKTKNTVTKKNILQVVFLGLAILVIAACIYIPANKGAGGLGFYPLEWPKIFLGPNVLNWGDWFLRMQVYEQAKNYRTIIIYDTIAILITLICIHGTRLIGLFPSRKIYQKLGWEKLLFIFPGIIIFHFLGLYTLQVSGGFNVFNFFVVSTVMMSLLSAIVMATYVPQQRLFKVALIVGVVLLTIPRVVYETVHMLSSYSHISKNSTLISRDEVNGLTYIKHHTPRDAIVQSHPANPLDHTTPYVAAFTERLSYAAGEGLQATHNQPVKYKGKQMNEMFNQMNTEGFVSGARKYNINVIYLNKVAEQKLHFNPDNNLLKKIYENKSVVVYEVVKT